MKQITLLLSAIYLLLFVISCNDDKQQEELLFKNSVKSGNLDFSKNETSEKSQNIIFNYQLLDTGKIIVSDFFEEQIRLEITKKETNDKVILWEGKIKDSPNSYVLFTKIDNVIIGNISIDGILYQIRDIGNNLHQLIKINQDKFPNEKEPIIPKIENDFPVFADCPNTDSADIIDIMVVYTQDAETGSGSTASMIAEIYLAVHETNFSYQESGINQRINIVHIEEITYTESGNINTDLAWVQSNTNVLNKRDSFSADAVVMITEDGGGYCGLGYLMSTVTPTFDAYAFSVVARSCATGYYSFGHELGHNMGARHDCGNDSTLTPYVDGHGFSHCGTNKYRTVMSYDNCSEPRVPRWSNPALTFNSVAMGDNSGTCQSCNACALNNTALTVANFRCSSAPTDKVHMKDTWQDTGIEPNPNTAGEHMWTSPYIWVRNQQDNGFVYQHQHQNPELGQSNWVYVKLHNGSNTIQSGDLELYYANASISLSWPTSWTLLTSIPSNIAASSTSIVDYEWSTLPGTGHYCMIARWNSTTDLMHTIETSDINYNTLQNNNIVWKNLNIIDLMADVSEDVEANFSVIDDNLVEIVLEQEKAILNGKTFTEDGGNIIIQFDDKTFSLLGNEVKIENLEVVDKNRWRAVKGGKSKIILHNLKKGYSGKVRLTFEREQDATRANYKVHIIQKTKGGENEFGGVSYDIKTH